MLDIHVMVNSQQNRVSIDLCHMTVLLAQVHNSLRSRVFKRLALNNIEWSQIGHLMNFTQHIIFIMERDWNVEWG